MNHPSSSSCSCTSHQQSMEEEQQQRLLHRETKVETPEEREESNSTTSYSDMVKQAWTWVCWSGEKTYDGLDFAGEVVANFLGLTHSKYQWMIDMQEREEEDKKQRRLEARQRRQLQLEQLLEDEKRKLHELEAGGDDFGDANNQDLER